MIEKNNLVFFNKKPILYLIATPIGNIQEISFRALEVIKNADFVVAEDTRVCNKLLIFYNIKKKIIIYHKYCERKNVNKIIFLLKQQKKIVYLCDAGMPCISDPGNILVQECLKNNINVSPISGPNAALNAIIVSGLNTQHFYFHGFLKSNECDRKKELEKLKNKIETLIFYESVHRIKKTLKNMYEIFGDRKICIAREITKIHEEYLRDNLSNIILNINQYNFKGEFVIVVEGNYLEENKIILKDNEIINLINDFIKNNFSFKEAVKKVSMILKIPKNYLYDLYLKKNKS